MSSAQRFEPLRPIAGEPRLLPTQQRAYDELFRMLEIAPVVALSGAAGRGRTFVLRRLAEELDAMFIDHERIVDAMRSVPARKWEDAVCDLVLDGMRMQGTVVFDNFSTIAAIDTLHKRLFGGALRSFLQDSAAAGGGRLVLSGHVGAAWDSAETVFGDGTKLVSLDPFGPDDYHAMLAAHLGDAAIAAVDFAMVQRAAPGLDGYQLTLLAQLLAGKKALTTDEVLEAIERDVVHTNLKIAEVEELSFDSLPGSEHIARALETHVVLPFRRKDLAAELGLKPRRGVLLYGPPGTGKTSIGRALAHRMQGRFFLLDGSFVTEPPYVFFGAVAALIQQAKANSPCVLFIDDADVLFGIEHIAGLTRYLLSLLDGIESETASNVCVMMTAMDAKKVPEPLLRSGRVELWLETRLPDAGTRGRIIERWMSADLPGAESVDYSALAEATEGFTPADLRRLASDAKLLFAADEVADKEPAAAQTYLLQAIDELVATRAVMAQQLADDSLRIRF